MSRPFSSAWTCSPARAKWLSTTSMELCISASAHMESSRSRLDDNACSPCLLPDHDRVLLSTSRCHTYCEPDHQDGGDQVENELAVQVYRQRAVEERHRAQSHCPDNGAEHQPHAMPV